MGTTTRLREHGLRATPQRVAVYDALVREGAHLSAEEIHDRVRASAPGTSLGTVYRGLRALVEAGLVRELDPAGSAAIFDARFDGHHHLVCIRCGDVVDVHPTGVDSLRLPRRERDAFAPIRGPEVVFRGVCPQCEERE